MKCPGQDSRFWKQDAIYEARCPQCNETVEFFKDDTARKCPHCGHRFVNPEMDFGCAAYCQFAEQCLGALPDEIKEKQQDLIKDKVGMEVRRMLMRRPKLMQQAQNTARYAERLGREIGGDMGAIIMAAHLMHIHDGDLAEGQNAADQPGPRDILNEAGAKPEVIDRVESILNRLQGVHTDLDLEVQVVRDAAKLAVFEEECKNKSFSEQEIKDRIEQDFLTQEAQNLARRILLR